MQNNFKELYTLLSWAKPGCLGDAKWFMASCARPMQLGQRRDASETEKRWAAEAQDQVAIMLGRVMLRRTKAIIADQLPRKTDCIVFVELRRVQYAAYRRVIESADCQAVLHHRERA